MDKKKTSSFKTFMRLIKFISHEKWLFIISCILTVGIVGLTLYFPVLSGNALDIITESEKIDFSRLHEYLKTMVIIIVLNMILQWLVTLINNRLTFRTLSHLRKAAFDKLWKLPISYTDGKKTGELLSIAMTDTETISEGLLLGFSQFFQGIMMIIGTIGFMIAINVRIAIAVILITPLSLFVAAFIAKNTHSMFVARSKAKAAQTGFTEEIISNQKLVSAYNCNEKMISDFEVLNEELRKTDVKATFFSSITNPSTRFVNSMVYAVVCVYGAFLAPGIISIGNLYSLLSYATQYTKPFNEISSVITELQNSIASADRVFAFLDEKEEENSQNVFDFESKDAKVEFKNVDFSYVAEKELIKDLNLTINPGKRIAIVGPTGCGKTTLINLIMRFYDPCAGQIYISGTDVSTVSRDSIRSNVGMVLQETWLKHGTIRDNILMAKPDATDEELILAAKKSHSYGFIKRLPNKFDTLIADGSDDLSAGEKQLLCITRLMLAIPPMLILDEATSSIDTRTEIKIQQAFSTMMEGRTCFIVAHRLSTIRNADKILVMKDGNIVEVGSHDELIQKDGFYKQLYMSQISDFSS